MSEEIREKKKEKENDKEQGEKLSDASGAGLPPNFSQMLDKVLANPEIITAVASALSQNPSKSEEETSSETSSGTSATSAATVAETPSAPPDIAAMAQKLPEVLKLLTPSQKEGKKSTSGSHSADSRACLLNAMKPYMSKQRCEAIDYIVGFSRIADMLKHLK